MNADLPLALYIHIPWCEKKCPYCDFNSHQAKAAINEDQYIAALLDDLRQDLDAYKEQLNNREISSVFIGGGTPSLFSAESFAKLVHGIQQHIRFTDDVEITSEANPGSSEVAKFAGFREAGVNRLSIGIQSFRQAQLTALGRVHNPQDAIHAAQFAREAGFDNFNLDLMFGLPEQSLSQCLEDLNQAIELQPTHLSCYQLTIEPNTLFHHSPPITPDDEAIWEMQLALQEQLASSGYKQYEVSAYAQDGRRCRHNLNYWQYGDYLGIGAGAHAKITSPRGEVTRLWKIKHPASYMRAENYTGGVDLVLVNQIPFEFMMNALRLRDGFTLSLFEQRTQLDREVLTEQLENHQSLGLLNFDEEQITPTARGRQMLDSMLQDYLLDD
ncbi:MAG: radical SAM family heme chaperone HemW [Pseudomonadota bacterium]